MKTVIAENSAEFVNEVSQLIQSSKQRMTVAVNAELTLLYWHIGKLLTISASPFVRYVRFFATH